MPMSAETTAFLVITDGIDIRVLVKFVYEFSDNLQQRVYRFTGETGFLHRLDIYIKRNEIK